MGNVQLFTGRMPPESLMADGGVAARDVAAAGAAEGPVSLRPTPASTVITDDAVTELAKLFEELDMSERNSRRADEGAENAARAKDDAAEVAAMRQKASDLRAEGLVTGLAEIGAGVAELGASYASIAASSADHVSSEAATAAASATKAGDVDEAASALARSSVNATAARTDKTIAAVLSASAKGMEAGGKIAAGQYRGLEASDEADAKSHASAADVHARAAKAAHDDAADAKDALNKVLQWVQEMKQSENSAALTAASVLRG